MSADVNITGPARSLARARERGAVLVRAEGIFGNEGPAVAVRVMFGYGDNGERLSITIDEAGDQKALFRALASAQEVFGERACGKCKSADIVFRARTVKGNDFYEVVCVRCRAVLSMGAHKQGDTLFPRRHVDVEGGVKEWLPDNGWQKWDSEAERMV